MRIAGLDLSLSGLGAVVVPGDWDLSFDRVARNSFGMSLKKTATQREITDRLMLLSHDITVWLGREKATHAYVESLPTQRAFQLVPLAELRCAVRLSLRKELGIDIDLANQTSARHLFLGGLPKKTADGDKFDRKAAIKEALKARGGVFRDLDQCDAFVAANWGMSQLGVPHLQETLFSFDAPKPKRARARKAAA